MAEMMKYFTAHCSSTTRKSDGWTSLYAKTKEEAIKKLKKNKRKVYSIVEVTPRKPMSVKEYDAMQREYDERLSLAKKEMNR